MKSELAIVMHNWEIQVSNQWYAYKGHVSLCLTIHSALDYDWRSTMQRANDPNACASQMVVFKATLHLNWFKPTGNAAVRYVIQSEYLWLRY